MDYSKFIFLDIDGVVSVAKSRYALSYPHCQLIQEIVDQTNAGIVITSSWRRDSVELTRREFICDDNTYNPRVPFTPGWVDNIIGVTIRSYKYLTGGIHMSMPRGVEIKQWMDTHIHSDNGDNYSRKIPGVDFTYVIIDDDIDVLLEHKPYFIHTDSYSGINKQHVKRAIKILNETDKQVLGNGNPHKQRRMHSKAHNSIS